ncbi:hypothetical protein B0O99DRAFT_630034, partial [Bisporella sp. PMI_857]
MNSRISRIIKINARPITNSKKSTLPHIRKMASDTSKIQKGFEGKNKLLTTNLEIESQNINTASGVDLAGGQKVVIGSVLDLFAGRPSLKKLQWQKMVPNFMTRSPMPRDESSMKPNGMVANGPFGDC